MGIYRYKRVRGDDGYVDHFVVRPDGDWVKYKDHAEAVSHLKNRIAELEARK